MAAQRLRSVRVETDGPLEDLLDDLEYLAAQLDERRRTVDTALVTQETRGSAERLLLKIAIGAAAERLYLSYPRMDVAETRARVPSFYALDVMRAITGRVPDHRVLASEAAEKLLSNPVIESYRIEIVDEVSA